MDHSLKARLRAATIAVLVAASLIGWQGARATPVLRDGDLIFHTSRSSQSVAVQRATHSRWSHMGVVFLRGGKPFVLEASATVRFTPLAEWIARGERGHFVAKRLRDADTRLSKDAVAKLLRAARRHEGRPYDRTFEWSDARIYCSELVWKAYHEALGVDIGALQKLREFDFSDPEVKAIMRKRYGDKVPLDEPVISPQAMFDSVLLETL